MSIIAQGFIRIIEGENMTQSGGMEALPDFGYKRRLYFNTKILFGELDENLEGFTATEIPWLKFCFFDLRPGFLSLLITGS